VERALQGGQGEGDDAGVELAHECAHAYSPHGESWGAWAASLAGNCLLPSVRVGGSGSAAIVSCVLVDVEYLFLLITI
jgi:hypothetical protein